VCFTPRRAEEYDIFTVFEETHGGDSSIFNRSNGTSFVVACILGYVDNKLFRAFLTNFLILVVNKILSCLQQAANSAS